jgi:DNA-directed RNA polymerase specialized sigma24 family protein
MTLRYLGGLSTEEIAAVTGRTPTGVYELEARALTALHSRLADEAAKRSSDSDRDESSAARLR